MSPRDHYVAGQPPDFSRCAQAFKHLDGTSADWRNCPAVRREYERGLRNGWIGAGLFYTLATVVLVLAFHFLGMKP